ncbi:MAG: dihydroorotate dehydrogenase electron transfer subunit [Candidatus Wallacebacter cryptica]
MQLDVVKNRQIAAEIWELTLGGIFPYAQTAPGQFMMIQIGTGCEHVLRRPISIAAVDEDSLTLVYRTVGEGTRWLSKRKSGDKLDVLGPLGSGFPLPPPNAEVLVVGGGIGSPPLYQLASELTGITENVDLALGFRSKSECFWIDEFSKLGNLAIATDDGSAGVQGSVIDLVNKFQSAGKSWDYVYACGPVGMLRALQEHFAGQAVHGYVSLEERMACGVGACYGCVCKTEDKAFAKRICADGPVFDWNEVIL